jgi:NTP pyrophosphatase (non-canonical NTP hydrolase)
MAYRRHPVEGWRFDLRGIDDLQVEQANWHAYNFGSSIPFQNLAGMMEELGELSHAMLKQSQGIRGYDGVKAEAEIKDAIGDLCIFAMNLCNNLDITISDCIATAWDEIKDRDFKKFPNNGKTE